MKRQQLVSYDNFKKLADISYQGGSNVFPWIVCRDMTENEGLFGSAPAGLALQKTPLLLHFLVRISSVSWPRISLFQNF
jgi:hypothetical protein